MAGSPAGQEGGCWWAPAAAGRTRRDHGERVDARGCRQHEARLHAAGGGVGVAPPRALHDLAAQGLAVHADNGPHRVRVVLVPHESVGALAVQLHLGDGAKGAKVAPHLRVCTGAAAAGARL
jgi:hypothetical protein